MYFWDELQNFERPSGGRDASAGFSFSVFWNFFSLYIALCFLTGPSFLVEKRETIAAKHTIIYRMRSYVPVALKIVFLFGTEKGRAF